MKVEQPTVLAVDSAILNLYANKLSSQNGLELCVTEFNESAKRVFFISDTKGLISLATFHGVKQLEPSQISDFFLKEPKLEKKAIGEFVGLG